MRLNTMSSLRTIVYLVGLVISLVATPASSTTLSSDSSPLSHGKNPKNTNTKFPGIYSESALVDQESGRVYWHGGPPRLSNTISPFVSHTTLRHGKATLLSGILFLSLLNFILTNLIVLPDPLIPNTQKRILKVLVGLVNVAVAILLPRIKFPVWLVTCCAALYLFESYNCSTRQYLMNALTSAEIEEYMETLLKVKPVVTWKVRCFHYETQKEEKSLTDSDENVVDDALKKSKVKVSFPSVYQKKVITHTAAKEYEFEEWKDNSIISVWKRAPTSIASSIGSSYGGDFTAPYAKIAGSKVLLLSDAKAREDYFAQQMAFVTEEGQKDVHAEFATNIQVPGFKSKILVQRGDSAVTSSNTYAFWFFTLLGLTVPYRIWFDRHCDQVCVTLTKETFCKDTRGQQKSVTSSISTWLGSSYKSASTAEDPAERTAAFQTKMKQLALYAQRKRESAEKATNATLSDLSNIVETTLSTVSLEEQDEDKGQTTSVGEDEKKS